MILRQTEKTIKRLARSLPIVAITGPRQSGKTTLARATFAGQPYVSRLRDLGRRFRRRRGQPRDRITQSIGDASTDTLRNIEGLGGSLFNDNLIGAGDANTLSGLAGNDTLVGAGGDTLVGAGGDQPISR